MGTSTAVLQYPWSHRRLVDCAKRVPALHWDQKTQSAPEQHCAREAEVERVKGKSQVRRSETTIMSVYQHWEFQENTIAIAVDWGSVGLGVQRIGLDLGRVWKGGRTRRCAICADVAQQRRVRLALPQLCFSGDLWVWGSYHHSSSNGETEDSG